MTRRSRSSDRWLREHFKDPFVQRAQEQGWRSRAVFKLEEMDRRERLLGSGVGVVDLGAAPGAWSQYAIRKVGRSGVVVASDLLPMSPIPGVTFVQGDFREESVLDAVRAACHGTGVGVVLSDMAPNLSGLDAIDQPRAIHLAELALDLGSTVLKPGGVALIKVFQGAGFEAFMREARTRFDKVKVLKPEASRARSAELYVLARGRK